MKMKAILLTLVIVLPLSGSAQQTLSLQEARERALQSNKDIAKSRLTCQQTAFDVKAYKSNFYPRLNISATDFYSTAKGDLTIDGGNLPVYSYNAASGTYVPNVTANADGSYTLNEYALFPDQKMEYKVKNIFFGVLTLQQPLYMGGKITSAWRMAQIGNEMAEQSVRLSHDEVIVRTDEAYTQAVQARQLAVVARSGKQLLDQLLHDVGSAVRHGMRTRNDLMKVQVRVNQSELAIQKADNACRLSSMNLCHVIGIPLSAEVEVDTVLPSLLPDVPDSRLADRPEAVLLRQKERLADEQVKLQRSEYLPHLALFAGVDYMNGAELAGRKLVDNLSAAVGVTLQMPLLTFGENTAKIRSAKAQAQIARLDRQDSDEKMELEMAQARNNLEEARTEVSITQRSLEQADENLRLSRKQYDVGSETLSDLLDAQTLWQEASANVVIARCQLFLAHSKYLKAAGLMSQSE